MSLSAFCRRMQELLDQQIHAKSEADRLLAVKAMAEFVKAHSRRQSEPHDYKMAASGARHEDEV